MTQEPKLMAVYCGKEYWFKTDAELNQFSQDHSISSMWSLIGGELQLLWSETADAVDYVASDDESIELVKPNYFGTKGDDIW